MTLLAFSALGIAIIGLLSVVYIGRRAIDAQQESLTIASGFELIDKHRGRVDCYHDGRTSCSTVNYVYRTDDTVESQEIVVGDPIGSGEFVRRCSEAFVGYTVIERPADSSYFSGRSKEDISELGDIDRLKILTIRQC